MPTITFDKVSIRASKAGRCPECGRPAKRSQEFWQTISQFNVDKTTGLPRTRAQIKLVLAEEIKAWAALPTYHKGCEP